MGSDSVTADPVRALAAAVARELDEPTRAYLEQCGRDKAHLVALLLPDGVLGPARRALGAGVSRDAAVRHVLRVLDGQTGG